MRSIGFKIKLIRLPKPRPDCITVSLRFIRVITGTGGITLKSMQATAEAMGCRFVYAIIPSSEHIEDIITAQARKKAVAIVGTASKHMALENQKLPDDKIAQEVERLTREIAQEMPPDFWRDK